MVLVVLERSELAGAGLLLRRCFLIVACVRSLTGAITAYRGLLAPNLRRLQDLHQTRRNLLPARADLSLRNHPLRPNPRSLLQQI